MGFLTPSKTMEQLEEENERATQQLSISEKRALIAEAKQKYGKDWRLHFPDFLKNAKSGMDWSELKFRL